MQGYIYPNEYELYWGLLIVVYPYVTGLVAGAFILASLERVFNVKEVQPTYRLALLTALAFLLVAPLPLLAHLGHPFRSHEIFLTPNRQSAMAMFGFVYAWYLMVVLLLEIWFDYRKDLVLWYRSETGWRRWVHYALTLGATDLSEKSLRFDDRMGRWITIIGIPSAFLLHGYVGFIFGSVKANPWWSSVLMPVVFLFSAIVSGIALVLIIYMIASMLRWKPVDMRCADKLAVFLFYAMVVDVSLEMLDFIHRLYESEESIGILTQLHPADSEPTLHQPGRLAAGAGSADSVDPPRSDLAGSQQTPVFQGPRRVAAPDLPGVRNPSPDRDLQHPLERGDGGTTLLEEPARLDRLQARTLRSRRTVHDHGASGSAIRHTVGAGESAAALARR
jgi:predicted membrane protein